MSIATAFDLNESWLNSEQQFIAGIECEIESVRNPNDGYEINQVIEMRRLFVESFEKSTLKKLIVTNNGDIPLHQVAFLLSNKLSHIKDMR